MKLFFLILGAVIYALYLEVFKNQIWGWGVAIIIFTVFVLVSAKILKDRSWYIKLAAIAVFLLLLFINAKLSAPVEKRLTAGNGKKFGYTDEITLAQGVLKGVNNEAGNVEIFAGIPYAKPPVGELRWKEAQAADGWEGVRVCDVYAAMAMQQRSHPIVAFATKIIGYNELPVSLKDNYLEAMSEDCLYLNIWRPKNTAAGDNLPVLVYIHGGSLNSGQSYYEAYNGETLASQGIIVVTIAYRLGVFGYLADDELAAESPNHTTGNYGLLDQIAALRWVNENIAAFGGDAANITIAGESAGSSSVNALCVSPLAKGLFRRAIAESSGIAVKKAYHTFRSLDSAKKTASKIKQEFSCESIAELRKIPADKLVNTAYRNNEMTVDGYAVVEQPYLTYLAGNNNEEALLSGYNGNEADAFLMFDSKPGTGNYEEYLSKLVGPYAHEMAEIMPVASDKEAKSNYLHLVGMAWFGYSHYAWSNLLADEGRPAYLYYFTKNNKALADWHAGELPYFYGNLKKNGNYKDDDFALSETIRGYILNFVKTGDPNGEGLPTWESYNSNPGRVLRLDSEVKMEENGYLPVFKIFDKYMNE